MFKLGAIRFGTTDLWVGLGGQIHTVRLRHFRSIDIDLATKHVLFMYEIISQTAFDFISTSMCIEVEF